VRHDGRGESYLPILASQAGEITAQELTKSRRPTAGRRCRRWPGAGRGRNA